MRRLSDPGEPLGSASCATGLPSSPIEPLAMVAEKAPASGEPVGHAETSTAIFAASAVQLVRGEAGHALSAVGAALRTAICTFARYIGPLVPAASEAIRILPARASLTFRRWTRIPADGRGARRRVAAAIVFLLPLTAAAGAWYAIRDSHRAPVAASGSLRNGGTAPSLPHLTVARPVAPPDVIRPEAALVDVASISPAVSSASSAGGVVSAPASAHRTRLHRRRPSWRRPTSRRSLIRRNDRSSLRHR